MENEKAGDPRSRISGAAYWRDAANVRFDLIGRNLVPKPPSPETAGESPWF